MFLRRAMYTNYSLPSDLEKDGKKPGDEESKN